MIKPRKNFVLIQQEQKKNKGGLVLSSDNPDQTKLERAKVIAVGPEVENLKKGDLVLFKNYNLFVIELAGKEYTFLQDDEIIAHDN